MFIKTPNPTYFIFRDTSISKERQEPKELAVWVREWSRK
jgi:DNA phosphorothioation-dependent restriction protein DptG